MHILDEIVENFVHFALAFHQRHALELRGDHEYVVECSTTTRRVLDSKMLRAVRFQGRFHPLYAILR